MTDFLSNVGSFVAVTGTNSVLFSMAVMCITVAIGRIGFGAVKRFIMK